MEHESFEDQATADLMNERFINIKVDREERPDLDQVYMAAVQGMTGHGGWPMTVFLTPAGKPFYGGTYFPPADRGQMPSFQRVLTAVSDGYRQNPSNVSEQAERVTEFVQQQLRVLPRDAPLDPSILTDAVDAISKRFDLHHGGFGGAPKFPQAMALEFLLRHYHRTGSSAAGSIVETSLRHMALGGIYDQIGGGFHRYSVDDRWLVPHFEKMLYDNALLARLYLHAYQVFGQPLYRRIVEETLDYLYREMLSAPGGVFSTQDADSEGVEGKFYVWSPAEFDTVLEPTSAEVLKGYFGVTEHGNFEGKTILTRPPDETTVAARFGLPPDELAALVAMGSKQLFEARSTRIPPSRDDKILAAWNGLFLRTAAEASRALGRPQDGAAATRNGEFILRELWRGDRLFRVHKDGETRVHGYLEDYGAVADGLLALYEATFDLRWYRAAFDVAESMIELFWDESANTFFDSAKDAEPLIARPRDVWDNATPSGTSLACHTLVRLWALTGDARYERIAAALLSTNAGYLRDHGVGMGHALAAFDLYVSPPQEVAVVGDPSHRDTALLLEALGRRYLPYAVVAFSPSTDPAAQETIPLLAGRVPLDGAATAYVCRDFVCDLPCTSPDELVAKLEPPPLQTLP
jgi:uncharacterized protein YyaL (SSP411 family)